MKVLFFASSYRTGITVLLTEHILALNKLPDMEILAVSGPGAQEPDLEQRLKNAGIPVRFVKGLDEHQQMLRLISELSAIVKDFAPDIIMVQTNWQLVLVHLAKWIAASRGRSIYWIHGYRNNSRWKSWIALCVIGSLLRFFAFRVIASSQTVFHKFSFWAGKKKMRFLPLGVDQIFFDAVCREKIEPPPMKLIFAGQFREGKHQDWIVRAVSECRQTGYPVEAILPGEGPLRKMVMDLSANLRVSDFIQFPGNVPKKELIDLYHHSTLCVVASNNETFGSCIAEPMVCGLPLLTRPVGCAPDLIRDEKNGFFFSSEAELTEKLKKIMEDPILYQRVRAQANRSASYFSWDRICREEIEVFKEIQSGN